MWDLKPILVAMQSIHATTDFIQNCEDSDNSYPKADHFSKLVSAIYIVN